MGDLYEHQTPGPMRWWKDISDLVGMNMGRVWAEVVDVLDREARILGCVRLCSPLYITGTATAFTTSTELTGTGEDAATGYNYSLTVFH